MSADFLERDFHLPTMGKGDHNLKDIPIVLAGNAGGFLKTGKSFAFNHSHNDLLVTLAQAMGQNITTFGDPAFCTGGLSGLRA